MGVNWVRQIDRTYDVGRMRDTLKEALTTDEQGPKVIVASSECMLNRQRREKPLFAKAVKAGERMVRQRFGVDEDVCTGDHACIRLSGCPSLSVKQPDDPLRTIRSRRSTSPASAAAIAARWRRPPCSARPSIAPTSSSIPPAGTAPWRSMRAAVIGFFQRLRSRRRLRLA